MKVVWSIFWMKEMTSPDSPQPKQWKFCESGKTTNDGVCLLEFSDRRMLDVYRKWGAWRMLAYWYELWSDYSGDSSDGDR